MAVYKDDLRKTWYCRTSYRDENGRVKVMMKRGFPTKRVALDYEDQFRKSGEQPISSSMTFRDVYDAYVENKSHEVEANNLTKYKQIAKRFLEPLLDKKIKKLRPADYLEVRNAIESDKDAAVRYRNKAIFLMKAVAKFGSDYYEFKNNTTLIKPISLKSADLLPGGVWTDGQFELFISHVDNYVYKAYFTFLFRTGARRSEGRAIEKTDIKDGYVDINKSISQYGDTFKSLKTTSSLRRVLLDDTTIKILQPLLSREGRFLFGDREPLSSSSIQRYFTAGIRSANQAVKENNKDPDKPRMEELPIIRLHDLRHSHATFLINKGANIVAVSKRLGHSDITMTLKVYTHLLRENEQQVVDLLNKP